jgi:hypothetical protein
LTGRPAAVARSLLRSTWFWGAVVAASTFGTVIQVPTIEPIVDASWQGEMYMAAHLGLHYGSRVVFTFGPLGFLAVPVTYYGSLAGLAFAFALLVQLALCLTVLWAARRVFPLWLAVVLTAIAAKLHAIDTQSTDGVVVIAFVWVVALMIDEVAVQRGEQPRFSEGERLAIVGLGGITSALVLLVKLNIGIGLLMLWIVLVLVRPRARRTLAVLAGTTVVSFLLLWLVAHQRLSDLPAYLRRSYEITSGYSEAQGWEHTKLLRDAVLAAVVTAIFFGAAALASRSWPRRLRAGLFIASALLLFPAYKDAFVSHDVFHAYNYFFVGAVGAVALATTRVHRLAVLGATVVLVVIAVDLMPSHRGIASVRASWSRLGDGITATLGSGNDARAAHATAALQSELGVDPRLVRLLAGHRVAAWPTITNLTYAYGRAFTPDALPVFQSNVAYTPALDGLDAGYLASPAAPDRIILHLGGVIEGRRQSFETPRTDVSMLCRYATLATIGDYAVVRHIPDRCGAATKIRSVAARAGEPIDVPAPPHPDEIVFVRIHGLGLSLLERIQTLVYKADARYVSVNGGGPYPQTTRVLPGTLGGPLIMTVPRASDFPGSFALSADARTVEASDDADPHAQLRLDFYAMPVGVR